MNRKAPRLAWLLVGTLAVGCGGTAKMKYVDGSVNFDGSPGDPSSDAPSSDVSTTPDAGSAPIPGAGSKLVVGGQIQLIGSGPDTCTNKVPATTDRWCGFAKPATTLGDFELWVIDVTKLAAGVPIKCDTTDNNCLRLSTGLYSDPSSGFRINGFNGDTLTYSEVPTLSANGFIGTISAWHPGWTGARVVTSNEGIFCNGHHATTAAICVEAPVTDATGNTTAELHAGILDDQNGGPLPFVDSILISAAADATGVSKWNATLTPDGTSVAWSTRADPTDTQNLKVETIGNDASRLVVANDVAQWIVTGDSKEWLWLKSYNYDQNGGAAGTLQTAAYPAGTGAQTVGTAVGDFLEAGTNGVVYRTNLVMFAGTMVLAPDRDVPTAVKTLDRGVSFVFEATPDGKTFTYTKNVQTLNLGTSTIQVFDLYAGNAAGTTPCALTPTATGFLQPNLLSAGDIAAWGSLDMTTGEVDGQYTTIGNCITRKFASDVFSWTPIADEGFVYLDTLSPNLNVNEGTLRYGKVANGILPALGTSVQTRAGLTFAALLPSLAAVVYTVDTGASTDGLYINAALPFTATPVVPSDGGTGSDATTGADTGTEAGAVEAGPAEGGSETGAETGPETSGSDAGADADNG
jgi:hypothetical protein